MLKNPYHSLSDQEKAKQEASRRELEGKIKAVASAGRDCMADERFIRYREAYEVAVKAGIKLLQNSNEADPMQYALLCKAVLSKIDGLGMLIDLVEKDAKKGK